jgi:peptidoglycan/LPS O-acetylase OafA/YrhL
MYTHGESEGMETNCASRIHRFFPPLQPESGHLLHLDALRLIASAGIVVLHMATFLDADGVSDRLVNSTRSFTLFVDMFFAVSGFVIAFVYLAKITNLRSYGSFLRMRLARLGPLHWLTLAFFAALGLTVHFLHISVNHEELYDWRCLPSSLLFLNSVGFCPHRAFNGVSWSIGAEMVMYVCAPVLFWIMRRNIVVVGLIAASAWLALTLIPLSPWYTWTFAGGFIRAIPSFAFGAWLFGVRGTLAKLPFASWGFWLCVLCFVGGCLIGIPDLALLLTLYATVACGVAADAQQRPSRVVSKLAAGGQLTYSSYMLHPLVMIFLLNTLADHILHTHGWARNSLLVLAFSAVWPISYLSLVFLERPARRWIGGQVSAVPNLSAPQHKRSPSGLPLVPRQSR